jgi:NTE family protein
MVKSKIDVAPKVDWDGVKKVNLALQGGGSHGAFTWGVLDAILEDGRLDIEAVTGTSAGAMNAVVLAQGYLDGGREGARKALDLFWRLTSDENALLPEQRDLFDKFMKGVAFENTPAFWWMDLVTHYASPYEFNPFNLNPLREHLEKCVDFAKVRACEQIKVFVAATRVDNGMIEIFERDVLTADHVLASACLPLLFQAVEVDGVAYWDGGYMGNPALFPLFYKSASPDIIIVQINPIVRPETPRTSKDIQNRLNEITFNGALMSELRSIDFVSRLVDEGKLSRDDYMRPLVHRIEADKQLMQFSAASKFDTSWPFLQQLKEAGRTAAKNWLAANFNSIGVNGTLDLRMAFHPDLK